MTFVKGVSGNPGGRPKKKPVSDALVEELRRIGRGDQTKAQLAARKLVSLMLAGDVHAAKLVLAYVEGLPKQEININLRERAEQLADELGVDASELIAEAERIAANA